MESAEVKRVLDIDGLVIPNNQGVSNVRYEINEDNIQLEWGEESELPSISAGREYSTQLWLFKGETSRSVNTFSTFPIDEDEEFGGVHFKISFYDDIETEQPNSITIIEDIAMKVAPFGLKQIEFGLRTIAKGLREVFLGFISLIFPPKNDEQQEVS